jgi:hypothetical protein
MYNISKLISEDLQGLCMMVSDNPFDIVPFLPENICKDIVSSLSETQKQEEEILYALGRLATTQSHHLFLKACIIEKPVELFQKRLIKMTDIINDARTMHTIPKWNIKPLTSKMDPREWYGKHFSV